MMAGRKADTRESQMVGSTEVMKVRKTVPKKVNWRVHPRAFRKEDPLIVLLDDQMAKMRVWRKVDRRVSQKVLSMDILMALTMAQQKENWRVHPKDYAKEDPMIDRSDEQMETWKVRTMDEPKVSTTENQMGLMKEPSMVHGTE